MLKYKNIIKEGYRNNKNLLRELFPVAYHFFTKLEQQLSDGIYIRTAKNVHLYFKDSFLTYITFNFPPEQKPFIVLSPQYNTNIVKGTINRSYLLFNGLFQNIISQHSQKSYPNWLKQEKDTIQIYSDARAVFFNALITEIKNIKVHDKINAYQQYLDEQIKQSQKFSKEQRKERLDNAPNKPEIFEATITVFKRNPDVITEVLERANGFCEECGNQAPFRRASDGSHYLEVHHKEPLSKGGDDTVENAIALCPNCHRKAHYG
jgi:RNA polymerase-binding transcription factor DksA